MKLLIHKSFEKSLKNISCLNPKEESVYSMISWENKNFSKLCILLIARHLKNAGLTVSVQLREQKLTRTELLLEIAPTHNTIYFLSKTALKENNPAEEDVVNILPLDEQQHQKNLLILFDKDTINRFPRDILDFPHVELSKQESYYHFIFELLKQLLPNSSDLQKIFDEFHQYKIALNNNSISHTHFSTTVSKNEKSYELPKAKKQRRSLSHLVMSVLSIFLMIFGGFFWNDHVFFTRIFSRMQPVHSNLELPIKAVLLNRSQIINQIKEKIKEQASTLQKIALIGVGGSGKTTLARLYASYQNTDVVWEINAENKNSIFNSLEELSFTLCHTAEEKKLVTGFGGIKKPEEREKRIFQFVKDKLKVASSWLLIYDNADNINEIWKYFPPKPEKHRKGQIIVTTRNSNIQLNSHIPQIISVTELSTHEKLDLFLSILTLDTPQKFTTAQKKDAEAFLKHLPSFPLDVSTAAYYLKATNSTYSHYLKHIQKPIDDFNEIQKSILGNTGDYTKSRYQIISMSLQQLLDIDPKFDKLLLLMSLLDATRIPRELLEELQDDISVDKLIINLKKYSLITNQSSYSAPSLKID